jgi:hypothetical protein
VCNGNVVRLPPKPSTPEPSRHISAIGKSPTLYEDGREAVLRLLAGLRRGGGYCRARGEGRWGREDDQAAQGHDGSADGYRQGAGDWNGDPAALASGNGILKAAREFGTGSSVVQRIKAQAAAAPG